MCVCDICVLQINVHAETYPETFILAQGFIIYHLVVNQVVFMLGKKLDPT